VKFSREAVATDVNWPGIFFLLYVAQILQLVVDICALFAPYVAQNCAQHGTSYSLD
jgi:hypothetical protein